MTEPIYIFKPCVICGRETEYACADCMINKGESVHICDSPLCRDVHELEEHKDLKKH